jgi:hypothetical protein
MAKQTYTTGQVLTAAQMTTLQANDYNWTVSAKTGNYTLVAADAGTRITMTSATATAITVNTGVFTAGDILEIINLGAGILTITAGTATVNTAGSLALGQYESGVLFFNSTGAAIFSDYYQASGSTSPLTTKGDLYGYSTTNARVPIGTDGQVLTADSTAALGLKWATPSAGGGGKVLQVVNANTTTAVSSSSATHADTGLTATITPTASTSKILVLVSQTGLKKTAAASNTFLALKLLRGSTVISTFEDTAAFTNSSQENRVGGSSASYLDSPATTSATTYKTTFASGAGTASVTVQEAACMSTITLLEIGA